jgi:hypothetical protein
VPVACLEEGCGWQRAEASYNMAQYHASKAHGKSSLRMVVPASDEEMRDRRKQQRRERYARSKEQRQVRSGESTPMIDWVEMSLAPYVPCAL